MDAQEVAASWQQQEDALYAGRPESDRRVGVATLEQVAGKSGLEIMRALLAGELPEAWTPPGQILELRMRVRLHKTEVSGASRRGPKRAAWPECVSDQRSDGKKHKWRGLELALD